MALLNSEKKKSGLLVPAEKMGLTEVGNVRPSRAAQMVEGTVLGMPKATMAQRAEVEGITQAQPGARGLNMVKKVIPKKRMMGFGSYQA